MHMSFSGVCGFLGTCYIQELTLGKYLELGPTCKVTYCPETSSHPVSNALPMTAQLLLLIPQASPGLKETSLGGEKKMPLQPAWAWSALLDQFLFPTRGSSSPQALSRMGPLVAGKQTWPWSCVNNLSHVCLPGVFQALSTENKELIHLNINEVWPSQALHAEGACPDPAESTQHKC